MQQSTSLGIGPVYNEDFGLEQLDMAVARIETTDKQRHHHHDLHRNLRA